MTHRHQATTKKTAATLSPTFSKVVAPNVQLAPKSPHKAKIPARDQTPPPRSAHARPTISPDRAKTLSPNFGTWVAPNKNSPTKKQQSKAPLLKLSTLLSLPSDDDYQQQQQQQGLQTFQIRKHKEPETSTTSLQIVENGKDGAPQSIAIIATMKNSTIDEDGTTTWTIHDAADETEIAFIEERKSQKDVSKPHGRSSPCSYRVYGLVPLYEEQEKSRHRRKQQHVVPVHSPVCYHWADLKCLPSGLFGRSVEYTMTLHLPAAKKEQQGNYRMILGGRGDGETTIVRGAGKGTSTCAKALPNDDGDTSSITIMPGTDLLLMTSFLATMNQL